MPRSNVCISSAIFSIVFFALAHHAMACTADKMKTTESGFIFKVVGGSDKVEAKTKPGGKDKCPPIS